MNDHANIPLSEQYRIVAKEFVDLEGAARMLEESKSTIRAQQMLALGDMPVSRAEMRVNASPEFQDYIRKMVEAKTAANRKRLHLKFLEMKFSEWQSENANRRAEMRL